MPSMHKPQPAWAHRRSGRSKTDGRDTRLRGAIDADCITYGLSADGVVVSVGSEGEGIRGWDRNVKMDSKVPGKNGCKFGPACRPPIASNSIGSGRAGSSVQDSTSSRQSGHAGDSRSHVLRHVEPKVCPQGIRRGVSPLSSTTHFISPPHSSSSTSSTYGLHGPTGFK